MAYIPPHKRNSKEPNTSSPAPSPYVSSRPKYHHRNPKQKFNSGGKILYAKDSISTWFVTSSNGSVHDNQDPQLPCSIQLKEFSHEFSERKDGRKPMVLVCDHHPHNEVNGDAHNLVSSPWLSIVERVRQDLLTSFQIARSEMCKDVPELKVVPRFVIRFGKVLFQGVPFTNLDDINKSSAVESALSQFRRRYYTNVPISFTEAVLAEFIPKIGLDFHEEKENYYVKVSDTSRPNATISCKCSKSEATGELDLYKVELNELRQLAADVSCLDKNVDLRLLLSCKRVLTSLTDEEKHNLSKFVKSGIIDPEVKGGMRWLLGKESLGDRYRVVGVWHTKVRVYKSSFMMLKLRHADRNDLITSVGEVTEEASLRIPELTRQLREESSELNPLIDMVSETLKLVWDHFLCWEGSFA